MEPNTVGTTETARLPGSAVGSWGPSVLNLVVDFDSGELLDTEIFEWEGRLVADEGIGRLTPAVE